MHNFTRQKANRKYSNTTAPFHYFTTNCKIMTVLYVLARHKQMVKLFVENSACMCKSIPVQYEYKKPALSSHIKSQFNSNHTTIHIDRLTCCACDQVARK